MSETMKNYLEKQQRFLSLEKLGRGEGATATKLREELEDLWIDLTEEEQEEILKPEV